MSNEDLLKEVFERYLNGPKIFKNRSFLHPDYIPEFLPHREGQIQQIGGILAPTLKESRGSNILIYGKTGTGKTAVIKYISSKLIQKGHEIGSSINACYLNCRIIGTDYRILAKLTESLGIKVPFTGLATNEVLERFKKQLDQKNLIFIIILDEIDFLVKNHGDTLLYELIRINEEFKKSHTTIIGISNDLRFKEYLEPRVLSSLSEEEIVFIPYTALELQDILSDRARVSFIDDCINEGTINLCAALAAAEHGDARRALDLLRVAGEITEREGEKRITENHIRRAQEKIEEDRLVMVLKTLTLHSKIILCSVYLMKKSGIIGIVTGEIYEVYKELCNQITIEPLTQRRISGLINELDILGILNTNILNLGRYGRTKKVQLYVPMSTIKNVYSEDVLMSQLIGYTSHFIKQKIIKTK